MQHVGTVAGSQNLKCWFRTTGGRPISLVTGGVLTSKHLCLKLEGGQKSFQFAHREYVPRIKSSLHIIAVLQFGALHRIAAKAEARQAEGLSILHLSPE